MSQLELSEIGSPKNLSIESSIKTLISASSSYVWSDELTKSNDQIKYLDPDHTKIVYNGYTYTRAYESETIWRCSKCFGVALITKGDEIIKHLQKRLSISRERVNKCVFLKSNARSNMNILSIMQEMLYLNSKSL